MDYIKNHVSPIKGLSRIVSMYWMKAFFLALVTAAAGIVPHMIMNKGILMMGSDWAALFTPQNMLISEAVKNGDLLWNWGIDIGGNFLESISLGSPFTWLMLLFPTKAVPYLMGWLDILKMGVAGLTSSLYLKRHIKSEQGIVLGALLYAFSGYQIISVVFYTFADIIAFFPLMLVGVEALTEQKKRGLLALAVILNVSCGLSLFFGEVLFVVIYFIVKYIDLGVFKDKRLLADRLKSAGCCAVEGLLGMAVMAVFELPIIINLLQNHRVSERIPIENWFSITTKDILLRIKSYVIPADPMNNGSSVGVFNWYSNALYLPVFGILLMTAYILKNKDWKSRLVKILVVISIVPVFSAAFMAFSDLPYRRWYYMFELILALVTVCVIEDREKYSGSMFKALAINLALMFIYAEFSAILLWNTVVKNLIIKTDRFLIYLAIGAAGVIIVYKLFKLQKEKFCRVMTVGVMALSAALLFVQIKDYNIVDQSMQNFSEMDKTYGENVISYLVDTTEGLEKDILPYRYHFDENLDMSGYNFPMVRQLPSVDSFISTPHGSVFEFYESLGNVREVQSPVLGDSVNELLGVRYIVSVYDRPEYKFLYSKKLGNGLTMNYYEDENALPIGFTYDKYITKSEFSGLPGFYRTSAMLEALVIEDEFESIVSGCLSHLDDFDGELANEQLQETLDKRKAGCGTDFVSGKNFFSVKSSTDSEKYMFFSVPYDKHWKAAVNGKPENILNINGLMAVRIPPGESEISFKYDYTPLKYGAIISAAGILVYVAYIIFPLKKRERVGGQGADV